MSNPKIITILPEELKLKEPRYDELMDKLVNEYGLIKKIIKNKLDRLNEYYKHMKDL